MSEGTVASRWNLDAIEDAYRRWKQDPASVDESWRYFFEGFELGAVRPPASGVDAARLQTGVIRLIYAYRDLGHFLAHLDPLSEPRTSHPLLELSEFGLSEADLDRTFDTSPFVGLPRATPARAARRPARDLLPHHRRRVHAHPGHAHPPLAPGTHGAAPQPAQLRPRRRSCASSSSLHYAELFEQLPAHPLHRPEALLAGRGRDARSRCWRPSSRRRRTPASARSSSAWPTAAGSTCWPTSSRKPYEEIFAEFEENFLPESMDGDGDVKYHLGFSSDRVNSRGQHDPPVADAQPQPPGGRRSGRRGPHAGQADALRRHGAQAAACRC